jgi:hypothetical protein
MSTAEVAAAFLASASSWHSSSNALKATCGFLSRCIAEHVVGLSIQMGIDDVRRVSASSATNLASAPSRTRPHSVSA